MKPLIIGVAGGSGLAKRAVVRHIIDKILSRSAHLIFQERAKENLITRLPLETNLMIRQFCRNDIMFLIA